MKGITPVIATILLLLIAVAIVGIAFTFFSRITQTATENVEQQTQQQLTQMTSQLSIDSIDNNKVYVRNIGASSVSDVSFYIDGTEINSDSAVIPSGGFYMYTLDPVQMNQFAGQNVQIRLVSGVYSAVASGSIERVPEPVMWTNAVGVAVSGNNLTKTAPGMSWGTAGASSTRWISGNGYLEFTGPTTGNEQAMFGLNDGDADRGYTEIDYAFYTFGGNLLIFERGSYTGAIAIPYVATDRLRIDVNGGVVRYWKNGTLMRTSTLPATGVLRADTSLLDPGVKVSDAILYGDLQDVPQYAMQIQGVDKNVVNITNTGTMPLTGFAFRVNGVAAQYAGPASLNPGATGTFYVNDSVIAMQPDPTTLNVTANEASVQQGVCFYCSYYMSYWKLDEGSGTTTYDSSPYGNNGTLINSPTWRSGTNCKYGNCVFFERGYVDFGNPLTLNLTKNLTVSFWFYWNNIASPVRQNPLDKAYYGEFATTFEPGGGSNYYHGTSCCGYTYATVNSALGTGQWVHFTAVRDFTARTVKIYKNGESQILVNNSWLDPVPSPNSWLLGFGYTNIFNGSIDDVKILGIARSMTTV